MSATFARPTAFGPESPLYRPPVHFLRGCLGRFATGVAVVSFAESGDGPAGTGKHSTEKYRGVTVNSFTSVSIDPPLILVALQRTGSSHDLLRGRCFTVNVLGAEQRDLAVHFAGGRRGQQGAGQPLPSLRPAWTEGEHAPRLAGSLCYFECTPWAEYGGGDHTLFLGEVQHFDYRDGDALGYVNGQFSVIAQSVPGHEALL